MKKICVVFGTRPETIKMAPVIWQLEARHEFFQTVIVSTAQHTDLLYPFVRLFNLRIDYICSSWSLSKPPIVYAHRYLLH